MKNTQARTRLRVLRHLRLEVTFLFSTYFNIPVARAFHAKLQQMTKITTSVNTSAKFKLKIPPKQLRANASYLLELITSLIFYLFFYFYFRDRLSVQAEAFDSAPLILFFEQKYLTVVLTNRNIDSFVEILLK